MPHRHPAIKVVIAAFLALCLVFLGCTSMEQKRDRFISQGKASFEKGDFVAARLHFKNAIQIDPKSADAYLWLGKSEMRLNNPRNAFGALSKAVELKPDLFEAQLILGNVYLVAKRADEAAARAEAVLAQEPNNTQALMLAAAVAIVRQQPDKALEILAKVRKIDPAKVEAYLVQANLEIRQKNLQAAAATLEAGLKANPRALILYQAQARLAEQEKQWDRAEAILKKAQEIEPRNPGIQDELARLYILQRQWDKAETALRRKLELEPDKEAHADSLARFLRDRGRVDEGEKVLQGFIAAHPQNLQAKFVLANYYLVQRKSGKGEQLLGEIIQADPTGPKGLQARSTLAVLLLGRGEQEEADKLVQEILKSNPKDLTALKLQGLISLAKKDSLTAVNNFRVLTKEQPQNHENWLLLAQAHQVHQEQELAKEAAKKALSLKPDYLEARAFLYGIYLQNKDYDTLIKLIKDYLRVNDRDLANWGSLGDVYLLKGDDKEARAAFQKTIDLQPKNPLGYIKLAQLSLKAKQPDAAAKYLETALQQNPDSLPTLRLLLAFYLDQKQPAKALEVVRAAVARFPKNAGMHQLLGEILMSQEQFAAAAASLEEALTLNPNAPQALTLFIIASLRSPDQAQVLARLGDKAADPQAPVFFPLALAQIYEHQRQPAKAIDLYHRLLERQVAPPVVKNNLAYLLAEHQPTPENLARALALATEVLADNPGDPRFLDTLGWVYCRQGDFAKARKFLEKAVAKADKHPVLQYHLGFCLAKLGDKAAAQAALEKALAGKESFPERNDAQKLLDSLKGSGK